MGLAVERQVLCKSLNLHFGRGWKLDNRSLGLFVGSRARLSAGLT